MAIASQISVISSDSSNAGGKLVNDDNYSVLGTELVERVTNSNGILLIVYGSHVIAQTSDGIDKRGYLMLPFIKNAGGEGIHAFGLPEIMTLQTNHNHANDANGGEAKCHFTDDY